MRVTRTWARVISELTVDADIDMDDHKITGQGEPDTSKDGLRYGKAEIRNTEIRAGADIAYSKLKIAGLIRNTDIKSDADIAITKLDTTVLSDTAIATLITNGNVDKVDGYEALDLVLPLDVTLFDTYPATGDFATTPENINDGNTVNLAIADTVNQYAEVDLITYVAIKQWRQYGHVNNNGSGRWKIQYWDGAAWQDWETAIPTHTTADWTDWASPAAGVKLTHKIRLVCTTVDTATAESIIGELEVKY